MLCRVPKGELRSMLKFILGLIIGGVVGIFIMCIIVGAKSDK